MSLALASIIKVLIYPSCNLHSIRSGKNVGSFLEGKYPPESVLLQWAVCHLSSHIHHLDRDMKVRLKGKSIV